MSVMQKIFSGNFDEEVHSDFVKFSKGIFQNRYLVEGKKQKDRWAIKTGPEYVNYLVRACLQEVTGETKVTGVIVATFNVKDSAEFPVERIKQFMGIKQAVIDAMISPDKIIKLMDRYPRAFYALSFSTPKSELKIKAKAPKSAKPAATGEKQPIADFCSLKTSNQETAKDLFLGETDFEQVSIRHTLDIQDIVLPKGVTDPVQLREKAKRKGVIKRIIAVGEKISTKEAPFEA